MSRDTLAIAIVLVNLVAILVGIAVNEPSIYFGASSFTIGVMAGWRLRGRALEAA